MSACLLYVAPTASWCQGDAATLQHHTGDFERSDHQQKAQGVGDVTRTLVCSGGVEPQLALWHWEVSAFIVLHIAMDACKGAVRAGPAVMAFHGSASRQTWPLCPLSPPAHQAAPGLAASLGHLNRPHCPLLWESSGRLCQWLSVTFFLLLVPSVEASPPGQGSPLSSLLPSASAPESMTISKYFRSCCSPSWGDTELPSGLLSCDCALCTTWQRVCGATEVSFGTLEGVFSHVRRSGPLQPDQLLLSGLKLSAASLTWMGIS